MFQDFNWLFVVWDCVPEFVRQLGGNIPPVKAGDHNQSVIVGSHWAGPAQTVPAAGAGPVWTTQRAASSLQSPPGRAHSLLAPALLISDVQFPVLRPGLGTNAPETELIDFSSRPSLSVLEHHGELPGLVMSNDDTSGPVSVELC